jgi:hypothetical protein
MSSAQISRLVPLLVFLSLAGKAESTPESGLSVVADTPVASILPRQANRKYIQLPTLEYAFEIRSDCIMNRKPTSLLLSVADTRKTLGAADFSAGAPVAFTLRIPAAQIGPIAVEGFCHVADEDGTSNDNATDQLTISAALSAHASLRCESESDQKVVYVSQPLDVTLVCERPAAENENGLLIDLD